MLVEKERPDRPNPVGEQRTPKQTLRLILFPMLATFICQRLYLHLVRVQHIYPGGYLLHHLFIGAVTVIFAGFTLAFGARRGLLGRLAPAALGIGSAMVLDEITYLVATHGTNEDYVSSVSLSGAVVLMFMTTMVLFGLYRLHRDKQ